MYPLNYIIIEKEILVASSKHIDNTLKLKTKTIDEISSESIELSKVFPLKMIYGFNNVIITETNNNTFYYLKNRYNGETDKNYNLSELNNHIRRIHMYSGSPVTIYDKCYMKLLSVVKRMSI